jgi:hypothetical protein
MSKSLDTKIRETKDAASRLVPTVTASTMIADSESADKVRCHSGPVEIPETAGFGVPAF